MKYWGDLVVLPVVGHSGVMPGNVGCWTGSN